MKKILLIVNLLLVCAGFTFAQTTPPAKTKAKTTTTATTPAAGPTKKDGTPDMRYKANKDAAKPAGPLKKDGTPDMRYKANKPATTKPTTPATPKKTN